MSDTSRTRSGGSSDKGAGESSGTGTAAGDPWYGRPVGILIVFGYTCLTAVGILASMGVGGFVAAEHAVPARMYLYVLIGVTGYVFTTLVVDVDRSVTDLVKVGIRIPASLTLGLGVFLLASLVGPEGVGISRVVAGFAFLTGLYTNMTYKGLGALAERLYWGRGGRESPARRSRRGRRGRRRGGRRRGRQGRGRQGSGGRRRGGAAVPPVPLADEERHGTGEAGDVADDAAYGSDASADDTADGDDTAGDGDTAAEPSDSESSTAPPADGGDTTQTE